MSKKQQKKAAGGRRPRRRRRGLRGFISRAARNPVVRNAVGHFANKGFNALVGSGDYGKEHVNVGGGFDLKSNTVTGHTVRGVSTSSAPQLSSKSEGSIVVRHREFLGDVFASDIPVWKDWVIDATDPETFPWLSTIANQYEQYMFKGVVFEFVSTCGSAINGLSAALGSASFATQYNALDQGFNNKTQLLQHYFATSTKTSESCMHAIECAGDQVPYKLLWTRQQSGPQNGDPRLDVLGVFQMITQGSPSQYVMGELYVTYEVELLKARLPLTGPAAATGPTVGEMVQKKRAAQAAKHPAAADDWEDGAPVPPPTPLVSDEKVEVASSVDDGEIPPSHLTASGYAGYMLGRRTAPLTRT